MIDFRAGVSLREQHCERYSWNPTQLPDAVVFAESAQEVQAVVRLCAEHKVPIVPYGTGTSMEGHLNVPFGGISVDVSRMNRLIRINRDDLDCVVEPGITRTALNSQIRDTGLFFPIDPGADASLGGMASTRASGTNAVRYGTMRENVLAVKAIMADGTEIRTAQRARKSAAGYDLTRLMVGSEGTFGVIVELTLKLHPIPESIISAVCSFRDIQGACNTAITTIQSGIPIARVELLDAMQIRMCNAYSKLSLAELPTLFIEFHGTSSYAVEQLERFKDIANEEGALGFEFAEKPEDRKRLWQARHDVAWSVMAYRPGAKIIPTDACVPISNLARCVSETIKDLERLQLVGGISGHVGDGNFHMALMIDTNDQSEVRRAEEFTSRLAMRAISMEGTCTGEHGIGQGKMKFMQAEYGDALNYMRLLKKSLDPNNIMNPGKVVPM